MDRQRVQSAIAATLAPEKETREQAEKALKEMEMRQYTAPKISDQSENADQEEYIVVQRKKKSRRALFCWTFPVARIGDVSASTNQSTRALRNVAQFPKLETRDSKT